MAAFEAIQLKGSSWVIPGPTNIGVFETGDGVYLIDSGNDKESGRKINKILGEKQWTLRGILNTHSNADHVGANDYLQRLTNCRIFSTRTEKAFVESPQIEAAFLWGGYTPRDLKNKFFEAKPSTVTDLIDEDMEPVTGLRVIGLPGHYFQMTGFVTPDAVGYLGDCMFGENVLAKYKLPYIYDVAEYRKTIQKVGELDLAYYVLSHGEVTTTIQKTADQNLAIVDRVESDLLALLNSRRSFEDVLQMICDRMDIHLDIGQYALVGNTIRSFLSYLYNEGKIRCEISDNRLYWLI